MKFIKLTKFKTNPDVVKELADKISDTANGWQSLDYAQYPSIMRMISENNLINIREINVSTRVGPAELTTDPTNNYTSDGILFDSPFKLYIPLAGSVTTFTYGDESMEIDSPIAAMTDVILTSNISAGASHILRISIKDTESAGINRLITDQSNKMESFVKFFGLV